MRRAEPRGGAARLEGMSRFRYRLRAALLVPVAGLVLVAGCGGDPSGGSEAAHDTAPAAAPAGKGAAEPADGAAPEGGRREADSSGGTEQVRIVPEDRAIVHTGRMTVRAADVSAAAERAKRIVAAAGGYVAEEQSTSYGKENQATITFKIPPDRYPETVDRLGKELGRRESLNLSTEDVTEQVADVESRLKSARAALDQFRSLLSRAEKIGEILEIEREIARREADLEALQARQRALAARIGMATLTLELIGPAAEPSAPEEDPMGFRDGLRVGWESLVTAVRVGLVVFGALLPWLVILLAAGAGYRLLRRRRSRRAVPAPPAAGPVPAAPEAPEKPE